MPDISNANSISSIPVVLEGDTDTNPEGDFLLEDGQQLLLEDGQVFLLEG